MKHLYKNILVSGIGDGVFHVQLNRPQQLNALNLEMWLEIGVVFSNLDVDPNCRVIILSGNGRSFCSGIDLNDFSSSLVMEEGLDAARKARQYCKPVIAAIHGHCIGGAIDVVSTCDIRYCSKDAKFNSTEVAVGFLDIGSLNYMPKTIGNHSWLREVTMTSRDFDAKEAFDHEFVSRVFDSYDALLAGTKETAKLIASNTPLAVQGTKLVLNYARDHSATWNMSQLQTNDIAESVAAMIAKEPKPKYAKL